MYVYIYIICNTPNPTIQIIFMGSKLAPPKDRNGIIVQVLKLNISQKSLLSEPQGIVLTNFVCFLI